MLKPLLFVDSKLPGNVRDGPQGGNHSIMANLMHIIRKLLIQSATFHSPVRWLGLPDECQPPGQVPGGNNDNDNASNNDNSSHNDNTTTATTNDNVDNNDNTDNSNNGNTNIPGCRAWRISMSYVNC